MVNAYTYSNTAIQTTLSGSISNVALTITVAATTGFPVAFPYVLALDYGGPAEELVTVTAAAGTTLTLGTRGFGGTSAQSHSLGAVVRHVYNAVDATDFRTHEAATAAVHGVTGTLVGTTDVQTLTNKTLTAPAITNPTITGGGSWAGGPTITGATLNTASLASPAITGTVTGGASYTAPTITGPTITGTVAGGGTYTGITGTNLAVNNSAIGTVPLTLNAIAGTTANLFDIQLNATSRMSMSSVGRLTVLPANTATKGAYVNAASGFTGNLLEAALNATAKFSVTEAGNVTYTGSLTGGSAGQLTVDSSGNLTSTGTIATTGIGGWITALRQTDATSVTSSTVLVNDTVLFLPTLANASYLLDCYIIYTATAGQDIKIAWTFPAAASMAYSGLGTGTVNFTDHDTSVIVGSTARGSRGNGATPQAMNSRGFLINAGTGGNLQLQWAQFVSGGNPTTVLKGSWIRLLRVA